MIRVSPAAEPASFQDEVRTPGLRALAEMIGETPPRAAGERHPKIADRREDIPSTKFPSYWTKALEDLMVRYGRVCSYSCFYIDPVTGASSVDHMAPKSLDWRQVYEWRNYRLAAARLNSRKRDFGDVLDPFEVGPGWFQLELYGFQVKPADDLPDAPRQEILATIDCLKLNDRFCRKHRAEDARLYWNREVKLRILQERSPFVAFELRRQGRLNPQDR